MGTLHPPTGCLRTLPGGASIAQRLGQGQGLGYLFASGLRSGVLESEATQSQAQIFGRDMVRSFFLSHGNVLYDLARGRQLWEQHGAVVLRA